MHFFGEGYDDIMLTLYSIVELMQIKIYIPFSDHFASWGC